MSNSIAELLEWDSAFFGKRIARSNSTELMPRRVADLQDWMSANQIDCVYQLLASSDQSSVRLAARSGFRLVDVRMTLGLRLSGAPEAADAASTVRGVAADDVDALAELAAVSYQDSRFYSDGRFDKERCDELFRCWFRRSCTDGLADHVLVASVDGRAAGFVTCLVDREQLVGRIGLLGVDASFRGRGVAADLLGAAAQWFRQQGLEDAWVVTQGRNVAAQRVYQRAGFRTQRVDLWFHGWLDELQPIMTASNHDG